MFIAIRSREVVRARLVEIDLVVKPLADCRPSGCSTPDRATSSGAVASSAIRRDDAVEQPPVERRGGVDRRAGEEHLERPLAPTARDSGTIGVEQKQADLHARRGEARVVGGDSESLGGRRLAAPPRSRMPCTRAMTG